MKYCSRYLTAVKIKLSNEERSREIILGSAYLPYDDVEPQHIREYKRLVTWCQEEGTHLINGCDANSHHIYWGSRGESI
jgi:hypothetical protein